MVMGMQGLDHDKANSVSRQLKGNSNHLEINLEIKHAFDIT